MSQGPPRGLVRSIGAIMKIGLSKVMDKGLDLCSPENKPVVLPMGVGAEK